MVFINASGIIGQALISGSSNLTGSEALVVFMLFLGLFVFGLMFRLPVVLVMLLTIPTVIVIMAYNATFFIIGGIYIFILAGILVKMFFLE